jgi:hypothetical protein
MYHEINDDECFDKDEDVRSGLRQHIDAENEEKARTAIENGDFGYRPGKKYFVPDSGGVHAGVLSAVMGGSNEKAHSKALYKEYLATADLYPEIYVAKTYAKSKRGLHKLLPTEEFLHPTHIDKEQFIDLYSAVSFANGHGVALNTHVTINWTSLGYTDHSVAAKALQDGFFKPLHGWYKYNNWDGKYSVRDPHQLFWIYSHENSPRTGFHTHILLGVAVEMRKDFKKWVVDRVTKLSKIGPVPKEVVEIVCPPSQQIGRQWRRFQYLCKGLDPAATATLPNNKIVRLSNFVEYGYINPGRITCKNRVGMSRNLSKTEREKLGFKSMMERGMFDKRKLYTSKMYDDWIRENWAVPDAIKTLNL